MSESISPDKALAMAWGHFMRAGMFEEALLTASLARRYAANQSEATIADFAEDMMFKSAEEMLRRGVAASRELRDSKLHECSFCGKSEPQVRLGAGADAFICNECVATFSEVLGEPQ